MEGNHINFVNPYKEEEQKVKKTKKYLYLTLVVSFLLLFGGCITRSIIGEYAPENPESYDPITLKAKSPPGLLKKLSNFVFTKNNTLQGQENDRINILLLGMGGPGHDGPYLTDTIIIASIKPSTGQIAMISIPRDLAVKIPGSGIMKINNANSIGETKNSGQGGEFAREIISDTFDLDIPYYVRVDFQAFQQIVDEIDGVKIDVENSFTDHMYPAPNYLYQTVSFEKGIQNMDGETALKYSRSRHGSNGEGSDFARAKRQQKVLFAIKDKVLSFSTLSNPFKINGILNAVDKHIKTNIDFADVIELIRMGKELNMQNITHVVLDDSPNGYLQVAYSPEGAFLLEPKTKNFDEINDLIKNVFIKKESNTNTQTVNKQIKQEEPKTEIKAQIEIINGTWRAGLAARMKSRLEEKFIINSIGNAENRPYSTSGIYKINNNKDLQMEILNLQQEVHIPVKQNLPEGIHPSTSTDILLLLGEDMEE